MPGQYVLGLDIGGTKCAVVLCAVPKSSESAPPAVLNKLAFPTQTQLGLSYTLGAIYAAMDTILAHSGITPKQLCAIGISCGGPLDHKTGIIYGPPNLYGWSSATTSVPVCKTMPTHVRLPSGASAQVAAHQIWFF